MNENLLIIRKSSNRLYLYISLSVCMMLCLFINFTGNGSLFRQTPVLTILAATIHITLITFFIITLIKRPPAIILSDDGIELSDQGFFTWDMLESFGTTLTGESSHQHIVIYFKEFAPIKYSINQLEKDRESIVRLVQEYAGEQGLRYKGHEVQ